MELCFYLLNKYFIKQLHKPFFALSATECWSNMLNIQQSWGLWYKMLILLEVMFPLKSILIDKYICFTHKLAWIRLIFTFFEWHWFKEDFVG